MKKKRKVIFIVLLCTFVLAGVTGIAAIKLLTPSITFDFTSQSDLTHRASGFLYGFSEEDIPTSEIAESIGIKALATKTAGGLQHPVGDVRNVYETFLSAGGEMLMVYTQDMYDTWYYQLDSLPEYNERVKLTVKEMAASEYADSLAYCIYNEMDNGAWLGNFWEEENRYKFYDAWKETYNIVKEIDSDAKIAGPGYCGYNYDFIKEFLSYCKENDCLPQIMVWHELSDQSVYYMESNFEGYYSMCEELGIERVPVCISEYGLMRTNGIPSESVKWIQRLEAQDAYGCVAFWRLANNLSDCVADDVMPNSNYWVYNFYAKMRGKELASKEWDMLHSNVGKWLKGKAPLMNKGFIGMCSFDEAEEKFYVMTSGISFDGHVKIDNLKGSGFENGDTVTIKMSKVSFLGLGGEVYAPDFSISVDVKVRHNQINFRVPCSGDDQAFFIEITKGESDIDIPVVYDMRLEAEDGDVSGDAFVSPDSAYSINGEGVVRGICGNSVLTLTAEAVKAGIYELKLVYANGGSDGVRKTLDGIIKINGEEFSVSLPSTIKDDCTGCVSIFVMLEDGSNEIEISVPGEKAIMVDFVDLCIYEDEGIFCEPLTWTESAEGENAYYAIIPRDGFYKLSDLSSDGEIQINGHYLMGDGDGIFYFGRGYNKIVLPRNGTFSGIEKAESDESIIITPFNVTYSGGAKECEDENTVTGSKIGWISSDNGGSAEFTVDAPYSGYYAFTVEYANNEEGGYHDYNVDLVERYITVTLNGEKTGNYFFRSTYSWDNYKTKTIMLKLTEGENTVIISNDGSYRFNNKEAFAPDIGSITVSKAF